MSKEERKGKVWSFKTQLALGQQAEKEFLEHYHEPLILATTRSYDFLVVGSGDKLELKTDDWNHDETPNFFMERWSNWHEEKPGGPWQSRRKSVDRFCYYFSSNGIYYEFNDIKLLCKEIEKVVKKNKIQPILIRNQAWFTAGYKIPRELLAHLYTRHQVNPNGLTGASKEEGNS